ncbi:MAG: hypothetical protein PF495_12100 [Spirochaetales bacterium]|jgi:hypothetical protein|nr:hypothetical protein [Spirochaetales bacterium]
MSAQNNVLKADKELRRAVSDLAFACQNSGIHIEGDPYKMVRAGIMPGPKPGTKPPPTRSEQIVGGIGRMLYGAVQIVGGYGFAVETAGFGSFVGAGIATKGFGDLGLGYAHVLGGIMDLDTSDVPSSMVEAVGTAFSGSEEVGDGLDKVYDTGVGFLLKTPTPP